MSCERELRTTLGQITPGFEQTVIVYEFRLLVKLRPAGLQDDYF